MQVNAHKYEWFKGEVYSLVFLVNKCNYSSGQKNYKKYLL